MGEQARAKEEKREIRKALHDAIVDEAQTGRPSRRGWSGHWICTNRACGRSGEAGQTEWRVNPYNGQVMLCCPHCGFRVHFPHTKDR